MTEVIPISRDDATADIFREPPHNLEAEQAFLGAVFANNAVIDASPFLEPRHFALAAHIRVFECILSLRAQNRPATPPTVHSLLEHDPILRAAGGPAYIAEIAAAAVGAINAGEYARLIHELYIRRELIAIGGGMIEAAHQPDFERDALAIWTDAEAAAMDLVSSAPAPDEPGTLERLEAIYNNPGQLLGVPSGLAALDAMLSGFQPGQLVILAGRPSMGKTTLGAAIARRGGARTLFLSLEQSRHEIEIKMIADMAGVPLETMRRGDYRDAAQFGRVVEAYNILRGLPVTIEGRSGMTPAEIRAAVRRQARAGGVDLVIIDQLTHIAPPDRRTVNRVHQIGETLKPLKAMAREFQIPVILLHQLSRAVESRDSRRPTLADLRDSGEIEQDADVVMFVYREEYYLEREEPPEPAQGDFFGGEDDKDFVAAKRKREKWTRAMERARNRAEIIVAKQRMGPIGSVTLHYDGRYSRFGDVQRTEETIERIE